MKHKILHRNIKSSCRSHVTTFWTISVYLGVLKHDDLCLILRSIWAETTFENKSKVNVYAGLASVVSAQRGEDEPRRGEFSGSKFAN